MKFTTRDQDNDHWSNNCAIPLSGGWWYNSCAGIRLTSQYNKIIIYLNDQWYSLPFIEIKIRPKNCT